MANQIIIKRYAVFAADFSKLINFAATVNYWLYFRNKC